MHCWQRMTTRRRKASFPPCRWRQLEWNALPKRCHHLKLRQPPEIGGGILLENEGRGGGNAVIGSSCLNALQCLQLSGAPGKARQWHRCFGFWADSIMVYWLGAWLGALPGKGSLALQLQSMPFRPFATESPWSLLFPHVCCH